MTTIRRDDLRQRIGRAARAMIGGTTTAAGLSDGTTLIDRTRLRDTQLSPIALRNALLLFTAGTGVVGDVRRVREYDNTNGRIVLTPPASAQVPTSASFEIWTLPVFDVGPIDDIEKAIVHQAIDDAITRPGMYYHWRHYLTLVTDGDTEASGVTDWTASSATRTKSTSTVGEGVRSLRIQNTAANGYAESGNISVFEDETYTVEASFFTATGTANLIIRNVTAGSNISTEAPADTDQLGYNQTNAWGRLYNSAVDIPADCRQISIRLANTSASGDTYWENIIVRRALATRENLPSWVTNPNQITGAFSRLAGERFDREAWEPFPYDQKAVIQYPAAQVSQWEHSYTNRILAIEGRRPYSALTTVGTAFTTNEANTVIGDEDMILAVCMVEFYDKLAASAGRDNSGYLIKRAEWAQRYSRLTGARSQRSHPVRSGENVSYKSGRWY